MTCVVFCYSMDGLGCPCAKWWQHLLATSDSKVCFLKIFISLILRDLLNTQRYFLNSQRSVASFTEEKYFKESPKRQKDSYFIKESTLFRGEKTTRK